MLWDRGAAPSAQPQVPTSPQGAPATVSPLPEPERRDEAPAVAPATPANEVWRRIAVRDREGVLRLLRTAAADPQSRLPYDVLAAVQNSEVQPAREAAKATPGAASSESYRRAEERLGSANRLERARIPSMLSSRSGRRRTCTGSR